MRLDEEADRLYQLPLSEFTTARNTLAKRAGAGGAEIKSLAKPPVAAWAVNQLYWQDRRTYDALMEAAESLRATHAAVMSGRRGDLRAAGKEHEAAIERALKSTLALLGGGGHPVTDASRQAIAQTLRALPGSEPPGRLSRTLQPGGFEALAGTPGRPAPTGRVIKPAKIERSEKTEESEKSERTGKAEKAAKEKTERSKEVKAAAALAAARDEATVASRELRQAEQAASRAEFESARAIRSAARARERVTAARENLEAARRELEEAQTEAEKAERQEQAAQRAVASAGREVATARRKAEAAEKHVERLRGRA